MAQIRHDSESPLDSSGLCLLSLDGGGVCGLSTLYILKSLMDQMDHQRRTANLASLKPCEVFDLIGGTSTGGLIAIMLGRLEMDVDECITVYNGLMKTAFEEKSSRLPITWKGKVKPQFDSDKLRSAVKDVIRSKGASVKDAFNDGKDRECRTFICAAAKETAGTIRLRSYTLPDERDIPTTICDAALATSAATGFFGPVSIGARKFVDGALGANNPVDEVEGEAANIWCSDTGDLKPLVKCFISIGTGNPGKKAIENNVLKFLSKTLVKMVTETERTKTKFIARWAKQFDEKRYFRFNVDQGLQDVGLAEYKEQGRIEAATDEYLRHQFQKSRVRDCVRNLCQKQSRTGANFSDLVDGVAQLSNIAISGLGGVGKTQLTIELAYHTKEKYPQCSILWIPATNTESLQQTFTDLGRELGVRSTGDVQMNTRKLVQRHLSQERAGQWLLIVDNIDDIDIWLYELKDYLPTSRYGTIVCTTRNRKIALKIAAHAGNVIEVPEMSEEVAMELLRGSLLNKTLLNNCQDARELLKQLTFLPLAINQATAFINENGVTISEYLSLFEKQEEDVIDILSEEFEGQGRYNATTNAVASTWVISFENIRQLHPIAAGYLSFMSCINSKDIPQSLLPPVQSEKEMLDAVGTLSGYAFVTRRADGSLDLHRLVHLAMRNWLRINNQLASTSRKVARRLNKVFPDNDHSNRRIWRMYLPHAQYLFHSNIVGISQRDSSKLKQHVANCLHREGRWKEAEQLYLQVIDTMRELGESHLGCLSAQHSLAITYAEQGRLNDAEELLEQVVEESIEDLGKTHSATLRRMNDLATVFTDQERWKEAEKLHNQVLEARVKELGGTDTDTLGSMNNVAVVYSRQGRWKEAEQLHTQVIETRTKVFGERDPETLINMDNLAVSYGRQKRWREAETLHTQVLEVRMEEFGERHPETLGSMWSLAITWHQLCRTNEAMSLLKKCSRLQQEVLGLEHPYTILVLECIDDWEREEESKRNTPRRKSRSKERKKKKKRRTGRSNHS